MVGVTGAVVRPNVHIKVIDVETGETVDERRMHNLVSDAGLNILRDSIRSGTSYNLGWCAFGSGTTAPAAGDTALQSEIAGLRFVVTAVESASKRLVYSIYLSESEANGNTLAEIGLFTAASGGIMYCRALIDSPINKQAGQAVSVTWTLDFESA